MPGKPVVFLLRSASRPDRYQEAFTAAGFQVVLIPVLSFRFIHREALVNELASAEAYAGMILTSPRAAEAIAAVIDELPDRGRSWGKHPVYAVGPETARCAEALGWHTSGASSGEAVHLARHIAGHRFDRPLLFLCGSRRRPVLPDYLRSQGIALKELVVYETRLLEKIDVPAEPEPAWIVFFSPSGVEAAGGMIAEWHTARFASIGETTAEALRSAGHAPDVVAGTPSPEALVNGIVRAEGYDTA